MRIVDAVEGKVLSVQLDDLDGVGDRGAYDGGKAGGC